MRDDDYTEEELAALRGIKAGSFGVKTPGLEKRTEQRAKRERKNTRTKAEQARGAGKKTKLTNFRTTPEFHADLGRWAKAAGVSIGVFIEAASKEYAKLKKLNDAGD